MWAGVVQGAEVRAVAKRTDSAASRSSSGLVGRAYP